MREDSAAAAKHGGARGAIRRSARFQTPAVTRARNPARAFSIFRIADGRVVEQWCMFDDLARLRQLGVSVEHLRKVLKMRNREYSGRIT
jgi:hypothetical protein